MRHLLDASAPRVHALAMRMLGNRGEAEDVTQETFIRLWRQAPQWEFGKAHVDTWLHRVALNLCHDLLRGRRETVHDDAPEQEDERPRADQDIEARQRREQVHRALAELPTRQREAIVLQYFQQLGNEESARLMDISVEALESLLSRARRALRASMSNTRNER